MAWRPRCWRWPQNADLGPVATRYLRERFGPFDFGGITLRNADRTFDDRLTIDVGGRRVELLNLGPAHTAADSVVHVPDAGVLFAGDLLFIGCTPIVWAGPIENWVKACDAMIALDAPTVVPGHGPVTDADGIRAVRGYLVVCRRAGRSGLSRGLIVRRGRRQHRSRRVRELAGCRTRGHQRVHALSRTGLEHTKIAARWGCWRCRRNGWPSVSDCEA